MQIVIDHAACTLCEKCLETCPVRVTHLKDGQIATAEGCIRCGHCAAVCPVGAISFGDLRLEDVQELSLDASRTVDACILARRSMRKFQPTPLGRETIEELLWLAVHAPSGANDQLWQFTVIQDAERIQRLRSAALAYYERLAKFLKHRTLAKVMARLLGHDASMVDHPHIVHGIPMLVKQCRAGDDLLTLGASAIIVAHAAPLSATGKDDCVYAMAMVMIAAQSRGLGTCALGLLQDPLAKERRAREIAGIPKGQLIHAVIALGHPAEAFLRIAPKKPPIIHWR